MKKKRTYSCYLKAQSRKLRKKGKTYSEINAILKTNVPKGTLNSWCRNILLPKFYKRKIALLSTSNLEKARKKALIINREKRRKYLTSLKTANQEKANKVRDKDIARIALAMLCLGEASKSNKGTTFYLASSDKRIVLIFLKLLEYCFKDFDINKIRCTVQCRADQDTTKLNRYWGQVTNIPRRLFYKAKIDPRTVGKETKKKDYKGVLRIDYLNRKTQLELEILADLIFKNIVKGP